jgi:hypothetical protein
MITVECLACSTVTDYEGTVQDMVDVVCPACHVRERLVATPMNMEPPEEKCALSPSEPDGSRPCEAV